MDTEKPYTIEMEDRGEYLYVLVGGEKLTADIAVGYWHEISEKCVEMGCHKVLIEKEFKETVNVDELFRMAELLADVLPNGRIAFLDRYDHRDINELGKRLARNRNVMMQIFSDVDEAARWLHAN